jgi:hypothetical protein
MATRTGRPGTHIIGGHKFYNTITATSQHEQEDLTFLFVLRCGSDSVVEFMSTYYMSSWSSRSWCDVAIIVLTSQHELEGQELI